MAHLDDPALTGPDRSASARSIQGAFAKPQRRWWPQGRHPRARRRLSIALLRGVLHPFVLVLLVIAGGWFELVRRATPRSDAQCIAGRQPLGRMAPCGAYTFPRNSWVSVERLDGDLAWSGSGMKGKAT